MKECGARDAGWWTDGRLNDQGGECGIADWTGLDSVSLDIGD